MAEEALPGDAGQPEPMPRQARRARIAAAEPLARQFVPYGGRYRQLPVIEITADALVYRAENGRLLAELEHYAADAGESLDALRASEDTPATQALLHRLLLEKAADPEGPVLQELERHAQQTEPLLVTADGVVVNGNRRLAAMRALRARDPGHYAGFAVVTAAVLPEEAGAAELEFIEAALQMAPDVKLPYGWVNRRLKMRRQRETLGLSDEAIASAYRLEAIESVATELAELALAEDYLAEFRREPTNYALLADTEPLFRALAEQLMALPPELRAPWRVAGFAMIDGRAAVSGPMDRFFPFAPPAPETLPADALRRLAEERGEAGEEAGAATPAALADPARSAENAAALFAVIERLRAEHQELKAPAAVLKQMRKVRQTLDRLEIGRLNAKQLRQLRAELAAIEAQVAMHLGERPVTAERRSVLDVLFGRI